MGSPVGNTYKLIFLGAPSNTALTSTKISDLSNEEHPAFSRLFSTRTKPSSQRPSPQTKPPPRSTQQPSWRTLSLNQPSVGQALKTASRGKADASGFSNYSTQQESAAASQSFFENSLGTDYLEASFGAFESQNQNKSKDSGIESCLEGEDDSRSFQDEPSDSTVIVAAFPHLPTNLKTVKLNTVQSARQLTALQPQTVSITTIAAIIAIEPPKHITTRYGNPMMISNIIIGDETRSGFGITIWLPPDDDQNVEQNGRRVKPPTEAAKRLKANVLSLRPQDVIFVSNLALTSFQDQVYGSSMGRDRTSLQILYRVRRLEKADDRLRPDLDELCKVKDQRYQHVLQVKKVAAWAKDFVAMDWEEKPKKGSRQEAEDSWMPEDTMLDKSL
ncbi:hypothetical protein BJ508DRAFT_331668 [Ascobolus immersus RN42]|uniref:Nucleic acid-binding protein n=1 Tax=Ascobolus immersus RN42 TaxID=1160509 RepID=A0A3N4HPV8_ASCIM|nr:hypothetical protein BJ508DRAFT_331668 [Ascobolus immersus RN42]